MRALKKSVSLFLALVCIFSAFSVTSLAATKYKSYGGKYGVMIPVKSNFKTQCETYKINSDKGTLTFYFKSKGYTENVYFGLTVYADKQRQEILINKSGTFPSVNSKGNMTVDFSPLKSGVYYGLTFTYIKKGNDLVVDKDSVYQFEIKLNKLAEITPIITDAEALYSGNYIQWKKVEYAEFYRVYRKQDGTSWKALGNITDTKYTDKTAVRGEKYFYTVKAYDGEYYSKYNKNGADLIYLAPPMLSNSIEVLEDNKTKIFWEPVKGAEKYRVYGKSEDDKKYTRLTTVSGDVLEYIDKSVKEDGKEYSYVVRAVNSTTAGLLSNAVQKTLFGVQKPSVSCNGNIVTVKWLELEDADRYELFKKDAQGQWSRLYAGDDSFEYIDTDVAAGNEYSYSLIVRRNGEYSSFDTQGTSVYCLSEPKIKSIASGEDNSICLKWKAVEGARRYNVYRESPFEEYKLIGTTSETKFYDTDEKENNYFYTYYVEAVGTDSISVSGNNVKMHLYMEAPRLVSVKWKSGNTVKWERVPGATSYKVYRKTPDGSYKQISEVRDVLSYKDKTAEKNGRYYYTVVAMNGSFKGAYESGLGVNCLSAPKIKGVELNKKNRVEISWSAVSGADGYYVYRKTEDTSWENLGKTTSLSFTDKKTRESEKNYFYTVRAYNSNGKGLYNKFGKTYN